MDDPAQILVVDDDEETVTLLREILSKEGYNVDTAADGKTTLRGLIQFPTTFDAGRKYPALVSVYGGPEFASNAARATRTSGLKSNPRSHASRVSPVSITSRVNAGGLRRSMVAAAVGDTTRSGLPSIQCAL